VVVESRVPWSGIHNRGGAAGRGAQIPPRPFLEVTQDGARALAAIALEHFLGREHR
jgi:phage gpG-like protein